MAAEGVDSGFLESLLGYNARRAALTIIELFLQRMERLGLRPVEFSVLSLVRHNPGITSRQLCSALGILPPNLVGMVARFERRALIRRERHAEDGRAVSLYLTPTGEHLMIEAEQTASQLEIDATPRLTAAERRTLMKLLRKVYRTDAA